VTLAACRRADLEPGRPGVLLVHGWAGSGLQMRAIGDAR
jgi:esterase/lipase